MQKYATMPKRPSAAYYDYDADAVIDNPTPTVFEHDHAPQETGLLNASGQELFRMSDRRGIGFLAREGWGG